MPYWHPERPDKPARLYQPNDSFLLVGLEGSGRKTLGIIASLSLKRQYVDFGRYFMSNIGQSPNEFLTSHGLTNFKTEISKVLKNLLEVHRSGCVIGGLPQSCVRYQQDLLMSFASTNPVIYIRRMKEKLGLSLKHASGKKDLLFRTLDSFYTSCSNLDYFNLDTEHAHEQSTLKLKSAERNFLRFIHNVFGLTSYKLLSKDPFSACYTYALQVSAEQFEEAFNFMELECGADAINLVIRPASCKSCYEQLTHWMSILRHYTRLPIILDIVKEPHESLVYGSAVQSALRILPDAITVDLTANQDVIENISFSKGFVKMIGTYHLDGTWKDFQESSDFYRIQAIIENASFDSLRFSAQARSNSDNMNCFEFAYSMKRIYRLPITAYNTGREGRTSICLNQTLSPVVPSSEHNSGITIHQARTALRLNFILEPKKFAIFGSSVSYSLSPAMHNAAYIACGLPHDYNIKQSGNFDDINELLADLEYGGIAVTMPFKAQVLALLDTVDPEAQKIGAVNTVVIDRQMDTRTLRGFNTDHIGVRECLINNLSPANSIRSNSVALIIGAGGMARATCYALQTLGIRNICIYNRTQERAKRLAEEYSSPLCNIIVLGIEDKWPSNLEQPTMIISTIPAHAIGDAPAHQLSIPEQWLSSNSGGTFLELAYKPLETRFMAQLRQVRGWIVVDGLQVLLAQGVAQFELFTGVSAPLRMMQNALMDQYASVTNTASLGS